jgi:hypothetical protein
MKLMKDRYIEGILLKAGTEMEVIKEVDQRFVNDVAKDISHYPDRIGLIAIFENYDTKQLMASEEYTKDVLPDFCEELIRQSGGVMALVEILPTNEYKKKYIEGKHISGIGLTLVVNKYGESSEEKKSKIKESLRADKKTIEAIIRAFEIDLDITDIQEENFDMSSFGNGVIVENKGKKITVFYSKEDLEKEIMQEEIDYYNNNYKEFKEHEIEDNLFIDSTYIDKISIGEAIDYCSTLSFDKLISDYEISNDDIETYHYAEEIQDTFVMNKILEKSRNIAFNKVANTIKEKISLNPYKYFITEKGFTKEKLLELSYIKFDSKKLFEKNYKDSGIINFVNNITITDPVTRKTFIVYGIN